jgi:hypothetical protein
MGARAVGSQEQHNSLTGALHTAKFKRFVLFFFRRFFSFLYRNVLHNMSDVVVLPGGGRKGFSGATKAKFVEGAAARATVICGQLTYAPAAYNTPRMSG